LTTYKLEFNDDALKEWKKLDSAIREPFRKKLKERLLAPRVASARLSGAQDIFKIKLRASGFRRVYEVHDDVLIVMVLSVGKREASAVYKAALKRI